VNEEIGVGAILGAPLTLATLTTFLMTLAIVRARGLRGSIVPERTGFVRDMNYFLFAFSLAAAAMFVPHDHWYVRSLFSVGLVGTYVLYVVMTFRASEKLVESGHGTEAPDTMFLSRLRIPTNLLTIIVQLAIGTALLIGGAKGFIDGVQGVSSALGVSALLLSLIIIPIATELPEKVNSILWIRRKKDTLAFGNITGAMVSASVAAEPDRHEKRNSRQYRNETHGPYDSRVAVRETPDARRSNRGNALGDI
jgi:cation:H+ antiporter